MDPIHVFVPFFRTEQVLDEIRDCLEKGWTGLGYKTVEFEEAWKDYSGFSNAVFLNSATAGLRIALEVLKRSHGWHPRDEIITTPFTFVSTNHAILHAGLTPVFADIDETLCLSPASVAERITSHTRAVMFVGIGGNPGRYRDIHTLCQERGIPLILDAAHMAGTRWDDGSHVGRDADATVFSFQAVKNLPTADSGMVCFRRDDHADVARRLAWMGINADTWTRTGSEQRYRWRYDVDDLGDKWHGNSVMAAMGLVALRHLDTDNATRRDLAARYDELLAPYEDIRRVPQMVRWPSRHLYQVRVKDRDETILRLNAMGIFPGVHYRDNQQYGTYRLYKTFTPNVERASDEVLSLPLHLRMTKQDVERVADALIEVTR